MDESGAIATGFRNEIDRGDLIDSILPRPFQSFAQDNDRFVFVLRRRPSSFPAGHNFRDVARSRWQGEDGERGGGRYPCEFTEANILCYLHEKSANIPAAGEQNGAVFGRPYRSRYLCINPCARIRMMYFAAAMFATTTTSSGAFQKSCATCLPNVL